MEDVFGLSELEVQEYIEGAEELRAEKSGVGEFFEILRVNLSPGQRTSVLSLLWRVILADQRVDHFEEVFAEKARKRLKLSTEEALAARSAAETSAIE